jgi:O-antigen/teichoic acid export membrane protein
MVLALVSAPLLLRHLGVDDFGRYSVVLALVTLAGGITEGGVTAVGLRESTVREGADREALMRHLLGVRLMLTLVGVGVAVAFAALAGYGHVLVLGTALAGAGLLGQVFQSLLTVPLAADLRFGWVTAAELLRQVATVALIVVLVHVHADLLAFLAVPIPAALAGLALTIVIVRRIVPLRPSFDAGRWWLLLGEMIPFAAATAVNIVYFRVALIVVSLAASAAQTGYFATSQRILETLVGVPALLISAVFPILAKSAAEDVVRMRYMMSRTFTVAMVFGVWMALCLVLGAKPIIETLAGAKFEPAVPVLQIQALALIATFVAMAAQFPLFALRRHRALLLANLGALAASIALALVLVPPFGAQGAAIATIAAEAALALGAIVLLLRADRAAEFPYGTIPPVLAAAAAAAAFTLVPGLPDAIVVVVGTVVYFGLLLALRQIPLELFAAFKSLRAGARPAPGSHKGPR